MSDVAYNLARGQDVHAHIVDDVRPVIVASQCLGFAAVRYNGAIIDDPFVQQLARVADILEVCPEVGIGLGVPRPPIRMQTAGDGIALVQPLTDRDITADMRAYAATFLGSLPVVDGFILKARSPSCGTGGVNVYDGDGMDVVSTASGRFADAVLQRFGDVAVEDELALRDYVAREHFLTRVYAAARLRRAEHRGKRADLVAFHTRYKYLLMACDPADTTSLGRIVAQDAPAAASFASYRALLLRTLARAPDGGGYVNALMHMAGYVSDSLDAAGRQALTEAVSNAHASLDQRLAATSMLEQVVVEQANAYLGIQAFFDPFPRHLLDGASLDGSSMVPGGGLRGGPDLGRLVENESQSRPRAPARTDSAPPDRGARADRSPGS